MAWMISEGRMARTACLFDWKFRTFWTTIIVAVIDRSTPTNSSSKMTKTDGQVFVGFRNADSFGGAQLWIPSWFTFLFDFVFVQFEEQGARELKQIFEGQNYIGKTVNDLHRKLDEVIGRQERTLSQLSIMSQPGSVQVQGQQHQVRNAQLDPQPRPPPPHGIQSQLHPCPSFQFCITLEASTLHMKRLNLPERGNKKLVYYFSEMFFFQQQAGQIPVADTIKRFEVDSLMANQRELMNNMREFR